MTRLLKMNLVVAVLAAGVAGCSGQPPPLQGVYVNENDPDDALQFLKDGTWTMVGDGLIGLGGDYIIEGETIVLRMGGAATMRGEVRDDAIILADRDIMTGEPISEVYRKKE